MSSLIPQSILENIPDLYDTERSINPTCHNYSMKEFIFNKVFF